MKLVKIATLIQKVLHFLQIVDVSFSFQDFAMNRFEKNNLQLKPRLAPAPKPK